MRIPKDSTGFYLNAIMNAFPNNIRKDVIKILELLQPKTFSISESGNIDIVLNNENLIIPYRFYSDKIPEIEIKDFTSQQKAILFCLNTRNGNGHLRQEYLEKLINVDYYFIIPFVFQLAGEYVIEIMEDLDKHITKTNINLYLQYFEENPKLKTLTEARMTSYWNEYYRFGKTRKIKDYPGRILFDKIRQLES